MELLKWELRKIWQPGVLAAIAVLGALYYFLFPSFYIDYFCNGPAAQAQFDLSSEWVALYGPTLESGERAALNGQLDREIASFGALIAAIPPAAEAGIADYPAFLAFRDAYHNDAIAGGGQAGPGTEQLIRLIENNTNEHIIMALETFLERCDALETSVFSPQELLDSGYTQAMTQRLGSLADSALRYGFLPNSVELSTAEYGKDLAVWSALSVVLLLSPTLVRDRLRRVRALQWSSRQGRSILRTQLAAAALSALGLTAFNLTLYAVPFLSKGPLVFRDCGLYSLWQGGTPWVDWTYGTYLLVLAGLILALALAAAGLTVFLSQYSGDYVALLLKAAPLFVLLGPLLGAWILNRPFYFRPAWDGSAVWVPAGTEAVLAAALLLSALGLCHLACLRQLRREL